MSDCEYPAHQEPYFYYLFGVTEMGCFGAIDLQMGNSVLFVPRVDKQSQVWMNIRDKKGFQAKYSGQVDEVHYTEKIPEWFAY